METAKETNKYLNATEPWKVLKTDKERGLTILYVALSAINGIRVMFAPFLPFSSQGLDTMLGETTGWVREDLNPGRHSQSQNPYSRKLNNECIE